MDHLPMTAFRASARMPPPRNSLRALFPRVAPSDRMARARVFSLATFPASAGEELGGDRTNGAMPGEWGCLLESGGGEMQEWIFFSGEERIRCSCVHDGGA